MVKKKRNKKTDFFQCSQGTMCIQKSREKESREIGISGPFSRPQCFPISNKIFFLVHTGILLLGFLYKSQLFQFPANRRLFGIRCTHKHLLLHWNSAETDIRRKTNRCWFPSLSKSLYKWWIFFFFLRWYFIFVSEEILIGIWIFSNRIFEVMKLVKWKSEKIDFMDFDFVSFYGYFIYTVLQIFISKKKSSFLHFDIIIYILFYYNFYTNAIS